MSATVPPVEDPWSHSFIWRWRRRRSCFHHDIRTGESYVGRGVLVDLGRRKVFRCFHCGKVWVV